MKSKTQIYLFLILLLAFSIRVYHAGDPMDGYHSFNEGWYSIVASNFENNSFFEPEAFGEIDLRTPPLYSYLLYFSYKFFGENELSGRLVSILASLLAVYATFLLGKRIYGPSAGIFAALFCAVSPVMVVVGRNIQVDILYLAFLLLFSYFFLLAEKEGGLKNHVLAGMFLGLSFFTKFFAVLIIPPVLIYMAMRSKPKSWLNKNMAAMIMAALVINIPFYGYILLFHSDAFLFQQTHGAVGHTILPDLKGLGIVLAETVWGYSHILLLAMLAAIPIAISRAIGKREERDFILLSFGVYFLLFLINYGHSYYLLSSFPFGALILAGWISEWKWQRLAVGTALLSALFAAVTSLMLLAAFKYGYGGFKEFSDIVSAESENPVVVAGESIEGSYKTLIKYYCKKCEVFNYDKRGIAEGEVLNIDYSREVYVLQFAGEAVSEKVLSRSINKKTYALTWRSWLLMFKVDNYHYFEVKEVLRLNMEQLGMPSSLQWGMIPSLSVIVEAPYLTFYRLPQDQKLLLSDGRPKLTS